MHHALLRLALLPFALLCATPLAAQDAIAYVADCAAGKIEACHAGSRAAQREGDSALMLTFAITGCKQGNTISCSDEGMMLVMGVSGTPDLKRGVRLVTEGCAKGYSRACTNLGYLKYTGTGMARNVAEAARYYEQGCTKGSGPGCYNLALMVSDGEAEGDAEALLDRACELGEPRGCY